MTQPACFPSAETALSGRARLERCPGPPTEQGIRDSFDQTGEPSRLRQLRPPVLQAYTALAWVLVASLAGSPQQRRAAR